MFFLKSNSNVFIKKFSFFKDKKIRFLFFEPKQFETDKILLYFHGGSFVYRGHFKHFSLCQRYALEGKCKVLYVDYSLAPKYRFPSPFLDAMSSYQWVLEHAKMLGISLDKIIIGGDSAGGCIAADLVFQILESQMVQPLMLFLIYPVLDCRMETPSMKRYFDTPMWNAKLNQQMWNLFLQDNDYISPSERKIPKNFPFTYLEVSEFDCLHDEGCLFAEKLPCSNLYEVEQSMHGFDIKHCSITETAVLKRVKALKDCEKRDKKDF